LFTVQFLEDLALEFVVGVPGFDLAFPAAESGRATATAVFEACGCESMLYERQLCCGDNEALVAGCWEKV
jgi:hypothetical protein